MRMTRTTADRAHRPRPPLRTAVRLAAVLAVAGGATAAGLLAAGGTPAKAGDGMEPGPLTAPQRWFLDAANRTG
jgi:hypothetical protein